MRKRSELFFSFILVPVDFIALTSAFVVAYILRVKLAATPVAHPIGALLFLKLSLLVLPLWILIFALSGLYNLSNLRGRLDELGKIIVAVSGGVMVSIFIDFLSRQPLFPSKLVPIYAYLFGLLFVLIARVIVRVIQRGLFRYDVGVHRVLLVGSGELAQRMMKDLQGPRSGFQLVAALDSATGAARRLPGITVYTSIEQVLPLLPDIDQIMQADSALEPDDVYQLVTFATNHHISYRFVPNQFGLYATNSTFGNIAGIPLLEIRLTPLEGWGRIVKRSFDVIGSTLALIIFSPVFALVALGIALTDHGPLLYRQQRLSRTGKSIVIYKFRTMYAKYSSGPEYANRTTDEVLRETLKRPDLADKYAKERKLVDDPRVTPFGRWLRRTSLDELPQLYNVWVGTLSLVGPRPILEEELHYYGENAATFFALKPGLTGLWQISGRSDIGFEEKVKLDIYYVEHWSLWLDIKILLRTVLAVLSHGGAY